MQLRKIARERLEKGELENEQDHVCVLNSVARSIIKRCGGKHPTALFTWRGKPLHSDRQHRAAQRSPVTHAKLSECCATLASLLYLPRSDL